MHDIGELSSADINHHKAYRDLAHLAHIAQDAQLTGLLLETLRGAMRHSLNAAVRLTTVAPTRQLRGGC